MTDWVDRDGQLADGTPLRDVAAETPVRVREPGTLDWYDAVVISVDADDGWDPPLERVRVELSNGVESTYDTQYVKRRR